MRHNCSSVDPIAGRKLHVLADAPQIADFVRFSAAGSAQGYLLPHPQATYSPVVSEIFPAVSSANRNQPGVLTSLRPVAVHRNENEGTWEVECRS
jgi:hypothetical protein